MVSNGSPKCPLGKFHQSLCYGLTDTGPVATYVKWHRYHPQCLHLKAIQMTKQMNSFTFRTSSHRYVGMTLHGALSVQRQSFQSPHPSLGFRSFPPIFHQGSKDFSDCFRQFLWQDWVLLFIDSPWFRKLMAFMHAYSSLLTFNWLNLRKR